MDNLITSCTTSQAVIALHFLFVSCRSSNGCGWAYSPLKFVLDEGVAALLSESRLPVMISTPIAEHTPTATASVPMLTAIDSPVVTSGTLSWLRNLWLQFQQRQFSRCHAFVIPCIVKHDTRCGSIIEVLPARPFFDQRFLVTLRNLADAHPKCFLSCGVCFLGFPSISCSIFLNSGPVKGSILIVLNCGMLIMTLAFFASKRHGLDSQAFKCVTSSFRFATCVALLFMLLPLVARDATIGLIHPTQVVATAFVLLFFVLLCASCDCCPQLSAFSQFLFSVIARCILSFVFCFCFCFCFCLLA
jgi:hypothetical protein